MSFGWHEQHGRQGEHFWVWGWYDVPGPGKITKYVPPVNAVSIIGIQPGTAVLIHSESGPTGAGVSFAQTIFDTTTRADSARILLTNSTGATGYQRGAAINAKVVTMLSGQEGYLNDKYVDYESINANGELKFEIGNNFIVTITQVNQLADFAWKNNKTKRHIHTISLVGMCTFFEPGEWYTITVGSAGTAENISVVCECYSVRSSLTSDDLGMTSVAFREMYQNWTFDSNETARSIASGQFGRFPGDNVVVVGSSTYIGTADYHCDSISDDAELNNAIAYLAGRGGGCIQMTEGTFNSTSLTITTSNITLMGSGQGTLLNFPSSSTYGIYILGTSTATVSNIHLTNMRLYSSSLVSIIETTYMINSNIDNIAISGTVGINVQGIALDTGSNYNVISNCHVSNIYNGIFVNGDANIVIGNTASNNHNYGIAMVNCNRSKVSDNYSTGNIYGFYVSGSNNSLTNNYAYNNDTDTGIANTNGHNFVDAGTDTQVG